MIDLKYWQWLSSHKIIQGIRQERDHQFMKIVVTNQEPIRQPTFNSEIQHQRDIIIV
jgi:histidinol phosphatase-like enzyme